MNITDRILPSSAAGTCFLNICRSHMVCFSSFVKAFHAHDTVDSSVQLCALAELARTDDFAIEICNLLLSSLSYNRD